MILFLAEASRRFGCTEIFKEPSKFAWSDYYEEYFYVSYNMIVLVTNKRVMLLQVSKGLLSVDTLLITFEVSYQTLKINKWTV